MRNTRYQLRSGQIEPRRSERLAQPRRSARISQKSSSSAAAAVADSDRPAGASRKRALSSSHDKLHAAKRRKVPEQSQLQARPEGLQQAYQFSYSHDPLCLQDVVDWCQHTTRCDRFYLAKRKRYAISPGVGLRGSKMMARVIAKLPAQYLDLKFCVDKDGGGISPYHCGLFRAFHLPLMRIKTLHNLRMDLNGVVLDLSILPLSLKTLRLVFSDSGMERKCLPSLAKFLRRAKNLSKLELTNWSFDHDCMRMLELGNSFVTCLAVGGITGDDCINAFVSTWPNDSPLQQLRWFGKSTPTVSGVQQLLRSTSLHDNFECLSFDCRESDRMDLVRTVSRELSYSRLHELSVNLMLPRQRDAAARFFAEQQRVEVVQELTQAIQANVHLCEIWVMGGVVENICGVDVEVTFDLLEDLFDLSYYLRVAARLLRVDHGSADTFWCHIFAALRKDPSLIYSLLRQRPELVQ